jgi:hypothetical protein
MTAVERKEEAARNVVKKSTRLICRKPARLVEPFKTCPYPDVSSTCSLITGIQIVPVSFQQVVVIDQELILLTGELFSRLDLPCSVRLHAFLGPICGPTFGR